MQNNNISPFMREMITQKPNGDLEAPDNILKTVSAAYQQYISVRAGDIERIAVQSAILGMVGGNPPYDQDELEANGLGHIANFNTFKGRSWYEKTAQGYWNLINSAEVYVKVEGTPSVAPNVQDWCDTMARHYSDVTKMWEDFQPNFNLLGSQLTLFGMSPIFYPHEESPLWEVVDVSRFHIPAQTQVFISKLSNVSVETTYSIQDLYQIYTKSDKSGPWNKKALGDYLLLYANTVYPETIKQPFSMVELQRFVSNNDSAVQRYFTDTVRLVNMYQKEYDGKISHYIFSPDFFSSAEKNTDLTSDFLFFKDRQYESIEEAVIIFTANPGEWTIHGNLGLGQKMYAAVTAINMLDCSILDMSKMASTPLIKTLATGGREFSAIRFTPGVATDIGSAEFVQNTLGVNIQPAVVAAQYLTQGIELNAANSGDDPSFPDRATGSLAAGEARNKAIKEFGPLRNAVAHFYNTFDKPVRTTFIRFLKIVKGRSDVPGYDLAVEWQRRCVEDGVPDFMFDTVKTGLRGLPIQFRDVRATRAAGDGSTLARIMGLEMLTPVMGTFDAKAINNYTKDYVLATNGPDYVSRYVSNQANDELSGGASLARTEDNLMKLGQEPLFSADNDQAAHGDEHMGTATAVVQAVAQQQMSPVDADKLMALMLPHLTEHVQFMSKSPQFYRDTLNGLMDPYKQLAQWAQLNRRNAEAMVQAAKRKQQEDAAATQQVMDDAQRKDFVAKADVARADVKVAAQNERGDRANDTRARIMEKKVDSDADIKRRKVELEAQIKQDATAIGRSRTELAAKSQEELSAQLSGMIGSTPSTSDFEPL